MTKQKKLMDKENKLLTAKGERVGRISEIGWRLRFVTSSYKINKSQDSIQHRKSSKYYHSNFVW